MNTVDKVKALCKERKIPISRLEKECGFANGYIGQLKKGTIPDDRARKIADFFEIPVETLIDPNFIYAFYDYSDNFEELKRQFKKPKKIRKIPVFGKVAAGIPLEEIVDIRDWEEIEYKGDDVLYGLQVKGDSMSPRIMEGDVLIVKQQPDAESGDLVIAQVNGNASTCKRLVKHSDGISLVSFNPSYAPMTFTNEEIENLPVRILGIVIENRQKLKKL